MSKKIIIFDDNKIVKNVYFSQYILYTINVKYYSEFYY